MLLAEVERLGVPRERAAIETAVESAVAEYRSAWDDNRQFGAREAIDHILGCLSIDVPQARRDELVAAICPDPQVALARNVETTLRALRDAGLRLGIICDVGWTPSTLLRAQLERHGVLELFDHWSFSDEVGAYKPYPEIFRHAHAG